MAGKGANVPRLLAGVDITSLPLSPLEGFVMSRIDGQVSIAVLADLTHLEEAQALTIVERLIALGAAEWVRESVSLPRASGRTPSAPFGVPESLRAPPPEPVDEREALGRADTVPPPAEPADELDLDPERRARIDELYVALDLLDHYQVLRVARDAPRQDVRAAYFQLSKVFHPDTMFRKRLGPYKAKMEQIFQRLTEAYEVLGKKRPREEYDRYLALQDQTRAIEDALEAPPEPEHEHEHEHEHEPAREHGPEARARAKALMAAKLRRAAQASAAGRSRAPSQPPPSQPPARPEPAVEPPGRDRADVLRNLTRSLKSSATLTGGVDPVQRHVHAARRAEEAGDLAAAARELRLAVAIAPERDDVRAEHARVNTLLSASLAATYEAQAIYEQRHGKWAAAAISWSRVFDGRPFDARAAREAAQALIEAKGDLHRAKDLAQRATELGPGDVLNLRTLARVYIAAGLKLNARRVLERASALDPGDEMVETLLRELGQH